MGKSAGHLPGKIIDAHAECDSHNGGKKRLRVLDCRIKVRFVTASSLHDERRLGGPRRQGPRGTASVGVHAVPRFARRANMGVTAAGASQIWLALACLRHLADTPRWDPCWPSCKCTCKCRRNPWRQRKRLRLPLRTCKYGQPVRTGGGALWTVTKHRFTMSHGVATPGLSGIPLWSTEGRPVTCGGTGSRRCSRR